MPTLRSVSLVMLAVGLGGCEAQVIRTVRYRAPSPEATYRAVSLSALPAAATTDTVVFLGVEFPDPGPIGSHYSGGRFEVRTGTIDLTEATRRSLRLASAVRIERLLGRSGFRVRQGAIEVPPPLHGARFALLGRVVELAVSSSGGTGPHRIAAQTQVAWELFDLADSGSVFGVRTYGRAELQDSIPEAVLHAVDSAAVVLLADFGLRIALVRPRRRALSPAGVDVPAREPTLAADGAFLAPAVADQSPDSSDIGTWAVSGVVTIRGAALIDESAFILTRAGLALTSAEAVQNRAAVWVRFRTGVERPARVMRRNPGTGVALIQVPCPGPCTPVPWTLEPETAATAIVVVRAPAGSDPLPIVSSGEVRGRGGRVGPRFEARLALPPHGGEPIARARDGTVFAIAVPWRSTMRGLTLASALHSLDVWPASGVPPTQ